MREWEADAYSPLPIFLFNDDWVSEPVGVFYFPYRSDFEQPVDLIVYSFGPFET